MSVNSYLNDLHSDLYVNGTEREKIRRSLNAISDRLDSYFGHGKRNEHKIVKKETFGSYSRDTMLSRRFDEKSDIDYMIVFDDAKDYTPQTCLNWLKEFAEFWYKSSLVSQSSPTIVVELENIKFELIPAYENYYGEKYIPNTSSLWQNTNPKYLNDKMIYLNDKTNFYFKRIIRIIKYWNVNKNLRKYKSYELEKFLTEKFYYSYDNCNNLFDFLDWSFFYLDEYNYIDEYVSNRIKKAISEIYNAQQLEREGKFYEAEEKVKKILQ